MYGVTNREINNYSTHIAQYSRSKDNQTVKFDRLIEYNLKYFALKIIHKYIENQNRAYL